MPSNEGEVQPLFRERDRVALLSHFDSWPFDDVRANAEAILGQRGGGNMSGDGAWPDEQVELFRAWLAEGTPA